MENASKALLIAGSMLLMILVLTFAIYLFSRMSGQASEFYGEMSENEIAEFNQKFFNYENKELTIQDVISIINLARECNDSGKMPVTVTVTSPGGIFNGLTVGTNLLNYHINQKKLNEMLAKNIDNSYKCTVSYAENSKLVGNIYIEKY